MDRLLSQILRLNEEPQQYFSDESVHSLLTDQPHDYLRFVERSLRDIAAGQLAVDLPLKQVLRDPDEESDFRVMPCVLRGKDGVRKTVKLVGTNTRQRIVQDQITVGRAFCLHPMENFITHSFAGCALSSARTGACAALAVKILIKRHDTVAILGAGRIGYYTALYIISMGKASTIYVDDKDKTRSEILAKVLNRDFEEKTIRIVTGVPPKKVDVMILATTSNTPNLWLARKSRRHCYQCWCGYRLATGASQEFGIGLEYLCGYAGHATLRRSGKLDTTRFGRCWRGD